MGIARQYSQASRVRLSREPLLARFSRAQNARAPQWHVAEAATEGGKMKLASAAPLAALLSAAPLALGQNRTDRPSAPDPDVSRSRASAATPSLWAQTQVQKPVAGAICSARGRSENRYPFRHETPRPPSAP
jgi:hypothetical protein